MTTLSIQVPARRMRLYEKGALRAFFDADVGTVDEDGDFTGLFTIRDNQLIAKKDGGYFARPFELPRKKNGQPVIGDDGFPLRDAIVGKAFSEEQGTDGKAKVNKASYQFFDLLTEKAVETFKSLNDAAGNPRKKEGVGGKPVAVAANVGEKESGTPFDMEDDYPF